MPTNNECPRSCALRDYFIIEAALDPNFPTMKCSPDNRLNTPDKSCIYNNSINEVVVGLSTEARSRPVTPEEVAKGVSSLDLRYSPHADSAEAYLIQVTKFLATLPECAQF